MQRDVTRRKAIEKALLESEARYRALAEAAHDSRMTGDYLIDDRVTDELQALGVPLHFKPLWEEDVLQIVESLLARRENCPAAAK